MPDPSVVLLHEGPIATLRLNIPERHNALTGDDIDRVCSHLQQLYEDPGVRVLILTGSGDKTFCAGAALQQLGSGAISGERFAEMTDQLAAMPMPTLCAFNGSAYGGGSELGLACDFRLGVEGMRVFVPPARIGLCYPVSGIERFVTRLGINTAKRLLLASEELDGQALLDCGFLTQLVPQAELMSRTRTLAERLAGYAPLALRAMKSIADRTAVSSLVREEAQALADACNNSEDLREGFLALQEKRSPVFSGR